ncbi:SDR family NAD(P)-dependent oxidoreductase [Almyronema epifaneia]|uniref:SDR family NAD(P)-dependent oxidoreductase n=1 Tax=Almyronema epifaneia S1 TaxID=2991925 RepID=A0ABW6IBG9_9CYAN
MFDGLEQINALVVGASQGIGLGFVKQLLSQPQVSTLYATYRQPQTAPHLMALAAGSDRLKLLQIDVTQENQIVAGIQQIQQHTRQLHWVINCVGILHEDSLHPEKALRQVDPEQLLRYFQVNSLPTVLLAKHLLPLLKHSDRSLFAAISAKIGSIGDNRLGGWYGYRASKAALNMLMKTAAIEYSRKSPQTILTVLHPGTTDTKLSQPFQQNVAPEKLFTVDRTVTQLIEVMRQLSPADSGEFFSWDGSRLPW